MVELVAGDVEREATRRCAVTVHQTRTRPRGLVKGFEE
jgi:hypothetical protein